MVGGARLRGWAASLGLLLLAGCAATGTWPSAVADRTLTMPKGEHRLFVAGGAGRGIAGEDRGVEGVFFGGYQYGITDRLQYELPLMLAYRLGDDDVELSLKGGLTGFGYRSARYLGPDSDPRQPLRRASSVLVRLAGQAEMRVHLGLGRAVDARLSGGATTDFAGYESQTLSASGGMWHTPRPWLSVGVFADAAAIQQQRGPFAPEVALRLPLWGHVSRQLDIIVEPRLAYRREGTLEELRFSGAIGLDWHFD